MYHATKRAASHLYSGKRESRGDAKETDHHNLGKSLGTGNCSGKTEQSQREHTMQRNYWFP